MFRPRLPRVFVLFALLTSVPACADRVPEPATRTIAPPDDPHLAPPPREVAHKPAEAIDGKLAHEGRQLFLKLQCINCHSATAKAKGPNLEGLYGTKVALKGGGTATVDAAYIAESIRKPKAQVVEGWETIMPAYDEEHMGAEEMKALIEYIKSLKKGEQAKEEQVPSPVGGPTAPKKEPAPPHER